MVSIFVVADHQTISLHNSNVIMSAMAYQISSLTIVHSILYLGVDQRKHQSSASLTIVRGIHRWPVNSTQKGPVTRKMFPFDDVIMETGQRYLPKGHGNWSAVVPLMTSSRPLPDPVLSYRIITTSPWVEWVSASHCVFWSPGAEAPGHQYQNIDKLDKYWFIGPVSCKYITFQLTRSGNEITFKMAELFIG